jgi:hypothetical protein
MPQRHRPAPPALSPPRMHLVGLLGLAFLTATIFFGPVLFSSNYYWGSGTDLVSYQYPHREFAFQSLRHGTWPLWNPYIFSGVPFQTGVHPLAYPGTILGLIFPTGVEIKLTVFIHLALALFFMAAFLQSLRYSLLSAYLAGLVYALSGFAFAHLYAGHLDIVTTFAFAPLVLWSLEHALRRRGAGWTMLAGLAFTLMIISGHYQIVYLTVFGIGLLALGRVLLGSSQAVPRLAWRTPWDRGEVNRSSSADGGDTRRDYRLLAHSRVTARERAHDLGWSLVRVGVLGGVAALVSLFQVLPTRQSMQLSNRFGGNDYAFAVSFSVPRLNWIACLVPGTFGGTAQTPFWPSWSAWEGQAYLGLTALFLALLAVALGTRRHWLPLLLVIMVAIALAMGEHTPFYRLYFAIDPLVSRFRAPARFILPATMMAAWLAAQGLELALRHAGPVPWRRLALLLTPVLSVLGGGWLWLMTTNASPGSSWARLVEAAMGPERWSEIAAQRSGLVANALHHARGQATWSLVLAAMTVALLAWLLRAGSRTGSASRGAFGNVLGGAAAGPSRRHAPALLLVLLAGLDLVVFAQPYLATQAPERFGLPRETEAFLKERMGTARMITSPRLNSLNWGESRGLSHLGGYDTIISERYNRAVNRAMGYGAGRRLMTMSAFKYGPLWQVQGVRYLLSPDDLAGVPDRLRQAFSGFRLIGQPGGIYVYENATAFPRAFAVHGLHPASSAEEALDLVTSRPDLVRRRAVVAAGDLAELSRALPDSSDTAADQVAIETLTPNEVTITAQLPTPGLVVLTDQPWPGWRVDIDGKEARLWSVNADLHRAVLVPAGSHRVRFHYFPSALRWGLVVSVVALVTILAYFVWGRVAGSAGSRDAIASS